MREASDAADEESSTDTDESSTDTDRATPALPAPLGARPGDAPLGDDAFRIGAFVRWSAIALVCVVVLGVIAARVLRALGIE